MRRKGTEFATDECGGAREGCVGVGKDQGWCDNGDIGGECREGIGSEEWKWGRNTKDWTESDGV